MPKSKHCWDSNVFIAILTDEQRDEDEVAALRDLVHAVDNGHVAMVTSTLVQAEVLDAIATPTNAERFRRILNLGNVLQESVTPGIARRAGEIRLALRGKAGLKTADAVFISTALAHECTSLQTYDGGLLKLSERQEVNGLKIIKPGASQTVLQL